MKKRVKEREKSMKYKRKLCAVTIFLLITFVFCAKKPVYAVGNGEQEQETDTAEDSENNGENEDEEAIIVVIDPGHGGKNTGAICDDYIEKELTLRTGIAMKNELEKYEGVRVYMTREDDADLELTERTAYAKEVEADLFICLHYNMSALHKLYGAECWISSYGECYAKGKDFANIEMEMLSDLGLYDRGIKTRHNSRGTDYYGVIRSCTAYGIPSVLIEHCHLDQKQDEPFIDQYTWPDKYGILDATAVARYFGLKSEILEVDYSNDTYEKTPIPDKRMGPDTTPPEWCKVTDFAVDEETGIATGKLFAYDPDSRILYYTASFNYGDTYHEYYRYEPDENGEVSFAIQLPKNTRIRMVISALNMYGGLAKSETLYMGTIIDKSVHEDAGADGFNTDSDSLDEGPTDLDENSSQNKTAGSYIILAVCILVLCFPILLYYVLWRRNERERQRRIKQRRMEYRYEKDEKRELENTLEARERERVEQLLNKKSMREKKSSNQKEDEE